MINATGCPALMPRHTQAPFSSLFYLFAPSACACGSEVTVTSYSPTPCVSHRGIFNTNQSPPLHGGSINELLNSCRGHSNAQTTCLLSEAVGFRATNVQGTPVASSRRASAQERTEKQVKINFSSPVSRCAYVKSIDVTAKHGGHAVCGFDQRLISKLLNCSKLL